MRTKEMIAELRKRGLSNGGSLGTHSGFMDEVADRLENMLKSEAELISEITSLKAFKAYFDELYGTGLDVANWHENGALEPFDSFYDSAVKEMERES